MSNRNFDSSYLTRRQGDRQIAKNIVTKTRQNISTNYDASIINQIREGQSMTVTKGVTCSTVEPGCPCGNSNITTFPYNYQPQPIFNPSISYVFPGDPPCPLDTTGTFSVIFGPGTPLGGTFSIITPPLPIPPPPNIIISVNSVTGDLTIPSNVNVVGIYTVNYLVNGITYIWSYNFGYC